MGKRGPYKQYLYSDKVKVPRTTQYLLRKNLNDSNSSISTKQQPPQEDSNELIIDSHTCHIEQQKHHQQHISAKDSPTNYSTSIDNHEDLSSHSDDINVLTQDDSASEPIIKYTDNITREELAAGYLTAFFEGKITLKIAFGLRALMMNNIA
jgi:hypothetical protein